MSPDALDPVIHAPARLRIVVTLAALREGDALSFTRLQDIIGLTPGNLDSEKSSNGGASQTSLSLTPGGRTALKDYRLALSDLLGDL
jgi:hypothetical protein